MLIRKCTEADITEVGIFYDKVVEYLDRTINYPKWVYKVYPSEESVREKVQADCQFLCEEQGKIVGAFVLNDDPDGAYENTSWSREIPQGKYMVCHTLAIAPDRQGLGIGKQLVEFCVEYAKQQGFQAVRLDVVPENTPARKLYEKCGFTYAGDVDLERGLEEIPKFSMYERNFKRELLQRREKNPAVTKENFLKDVHILFDELKNSYGGYEYFGAARFKEAEEEIVRRLTVDFEPEQAVRVLREELAAFIYDGHFSVDGVPVFRPAREKAPSFDYAVKQYEMDGIPVFDIKKFYYDNEEEKEQLEEFAASGVQYKDSPCLIFDLRGNGGGCDVYLWDFLCAMTGEEPDVPMDFLQKNSDTFLEYLKQEFGEMEPEGEEGILPEVEEEKSEGNIVKTGQKIYVLVDRFVCSSGESAISYLKTLDGTILVGENSGGCYFCGNCMDIYLPNSGICVYYGTGRILYEGKRNIDEEGGFAPDIPGDFSVSDVVKQYRKSLVCDFSS